MRKTRRKTKKTRKTTWTRTTKTRRNPTFSPAFLSPLSPLPEDLSPDELAASAFLPSDDPFADAAAGSELFWLARLSVR